jgi:hypothetical protein
MAKQYLDKPSPTYDKEINLRGGCPLWSLATDALGAPLGTMSEYPRKPT